MPLQRIVVFAAECMSHFDSVEFRAPASAGDLKKAANEGFKTIVLSDALFLDVAPSHIELLSIIRSGVRLIGCSSAGALRAAELSNVGMLGFGVIYNLYKTGALNDDGELAVLYDSDLRPIAPPLVDLRYFLGSAVSQGCSMNEASDIFHHIKSIYFMKRSCEAIDAVLGLHPKFQLHYYGGSDYGLKRIDLKNCLHDLLGTRNAISIDRRWLELGLLLGG